MSARLLVPAAGAGALAGVLPFALPVCGMCGCIPAVGAAFAAAIVTGVLCRGISLQQGFLSGLVSGVTSAVVFSAAFLIHPPDAQLVEAIEEIMGTIEQQKREATSKGIDTAPFGDALEMLRGFRDDPRSARKAAGICYSVAVLLTAPLAGFLAALAFGRRAPPHPPPMAPQPPLHPPPGG